MAEDLWDSFSSATAVKSKPELNGAFDDDEGYEDNVVDSWDAYTAPATAISKESKRSHKISLKSSSSFSSHNTAPLSKEDRKKAEIESDIRNASDLFGDLSLEHEISSLAQSGSVRSNMPSSARSDCSSSSKAQILNISGPSIKPPTSKADFDRVYDKITQMLQGGSKSTFYVPMLKELFKELCKPLTEAQMKFLTGELNKYAIQKANEAKLAEKSKKVGGSMSFKSAFSRKQADRHDLNSYGDDDFEDDFDEFM